MRFRLSITDPFFRAVFIIMAAMFLFGGEINGTVIAARRQRLQARMRARQAEAVRVSANPLP